MNTAPNVHVEIVTLAELLAGPPVDLPPAPRRGGRHRAASCGCPGPAHHDAHRVGCPRRRRTR